MKKSLLLGLVSIAIMVTFSACTSQIKNLPPQPITEQMSQVNVLKAIYKAGIARGWKMHKVSEGLVEATYARRGFTVTISIHYSTTSYSISYKESQGLKYNPETNTIHKNYNRWIANLKQQIDGELTIMSASNIDSTSSQSISTPTKSNTSAVKEKTTSSAPATDW